MKVIGVMLDLFIDKGLVKHLVHVLMKILSLSRFWFYLTSWYFHHQCLIGDPHRCWFCILGTLLVVQNLDIWMFVMLKC